MKTMNTQTKPKVEEKIGLLTKKPVRKLRTSNQTRLKMALEGVNKDNKKTTVGFLPADRPNCKCANLVLRERQKLGSMNDLERKIYIAQKKEITCPRAKEEGMQKYKIVCKNCGDLVGYVHATDKKMTDWCNFHYAITTDGKEWYGGFTPNISGEPIRDPDTKRVVGVKNWGLGIECACGVDTRKPKSKGRKFGKKDSIFKLIKVK